ncbi:MAG: tRNA pseudouridine(55) synthase TruB [Calditrichia bacterium]
MNKPAGWSSFDAVKKIRNLSGMKKVGHAGTLDPFASGVLLICLGKATKFSNRLMKYEKEYVAELKLGAATDTLDITGNVVEEAPVPKFDEQQLQDILQDLSGTIRQRIPDFSAAQVNGQRMYKLARQGKPVPKRFKTITIHEMELLEATEEIIKFRTVCGKGTYIRALGADIARKLGTVGFLQTLARTRIGSFSLAEALEIEEFKPNWNQLNTNDDIPRPRKSKY